jgi:hypothetical protein
MDRPAILEKERVMEEKKEGLSRRSFLSNTAVGAIGLAAAGFTAGTFATPKEADAANLVIGDPNSFPHLALDVEQVRKYGYYCYFKFGGCGAGSSRALIQGFIDAAGGVDNAKGWGQVPLQLYAWGAGGVLGKWGTLCGALAGSMGVLNLLNLHGALGNEVMEWYTNQNFPLANFEKSGAAFDPNMTYGGMPALGFAPILDADVRGHSVADSPLCHISVSKWVAAAHVKLGDKNPANTAQGLKEDRCAKVTADTAAYTAFLLNEKLAGRTPAAWAPEASMAGCYGCHDTYSPQASLTRKDAQTQMDCLPCHTEPTSGRK